MVMIDSIVPQYNGKQKGRSFSGGRDAMVAAAGVKPGAGPEMFYNCVCNPNLSKQPVSMNVF